MNASIPAQAAAVRLTALSHGGGCGCKISPGLLTQILRDSPAAGLFPDLLVGTESADDAAVWQINESQALVATTDFFMPIVDDPFDFGRIAATNAISDVYAMGAKPIFALALVGMPIDRLPVETIRAILAGGQAVCAQAGIPVAGGHSIDSVEPIYGLVVLGLAHPARIKRNSRASPGDALVLGKGLGVGILSAALRKGELSPDGYAEMVASTTQLNTPGAALAELPEVHALTDVTGFGLAGHLLEMCRGAQLAAEIEFAALPVLPAAEILARQGYVTGASARNWTSYGAEVELPEGVPAWQRNLLSDPQTSGGLLVAVSPEAAECVLTLLHGAGFASARVIGRMSDGPARLRVSQTV